MTLPLLFLSGAGLPAWVWDDVRRRPPVDSRVADRPRGRVGLADCAEAARAAEADWPAYGVVAHSIGAVVAAALVTQDADRVRAVIGVCGIVPQGTDLCVHSPARLLEVATELNDRPRKTLGGITPAQAMQRLLLDPESPVVATTA